MDELPGDAAAGGEGVEAALASLEAAVARRPRTAVELAAIAAFLVIVYGGIEGVLKQVRLSRGLLVERSALWRKDALERAASEGLISVPLRDGLYPYLEFRDSFLLAPGTVLDEGRLVALASGARAAWSRFRADVARGAGTGAPDGAPARAPDAVPGRTGTSARRSRRRADGMPRHP